MKLAEQAVPQSSPQATPVDATVAILEALRSLISDRRFSETVNDIVVEFGTPGTRRSWTVSSDVRDVPQGGDRSVEEALQDGLGPFALQHLIAAARAHE
jgi:hypothetical protein